MEKLIKKIRGIDAAFAKALYERKSAKDILAASPWAWFATELRNAVPDFELKSSGMHVTLVSDLIEKEIGYARPGRLLALFKNKGVANGRFHETAKLASLDEYQAIRRVLLDLCALGDEKPKWAKIFLALCELNRECTVMDLSKKSGKTVRHPDIMMCPRIFHMNVDEIRKGRGRWPNTYTVKKEFYKKIYLPIKPWHTGKGLEIFKEWEKEYAPKIPV